MKYWIYLAWQYMMRHKSRTLYSIFGIVITFIMCFAVLTTGYSFWDYEAQCSGIFESQLRVDRLDVHNVNEEGEAQGITEEMIAQIRALEQCDEVKRLWITDDSWGYFDWDYPEEVQNSDDEIEMDFSRTTDELEPGHIYEVDIQLKDLSNLRRSAASLQEQCGLEIEVDKDAEEYLGQGDTTFKNFYQAIETILASIIALFCVMILRNTMMISVVERMKDYGIYRCVGMSRKQLYHVLAVEGLMMSLAAVVLGVGASYGLLQLITPWLNDTLNLETPFHFGFYYQVVFITTLLCIGVTLYALLEPSRQAGQLSPIEAIRNNIVLRNRKGKLLENLSYHQSGIWGRIFGVSGEYAYKNMRRNRGRFSGVFVSLLLCMTVLGMMESVSESLYASVENAFQGMNKKYLEYIHSGGKYNDSSARRIQKDIVGLGKVQDIGVAFERDDIYWGLDPVLAEYVETSSKEGFVTQSAYGRKDIESMKKYLIDGSIDYDAMTKENGVLLCDMKYNVESVETDFKQADVRLTDYKVGDRMKRLNSKGIQKVDQIYEDALDQVAKNMGISKRDTSTEENLDRNDSLYPDLEYCSKDDEGFEQYKEEFLRILRKQGIRLDGQKVEECNRINGFWYLLTRWIFEQKEQPEYVTEYVIQGIISEDAVFGSSYSNIKFIHTIDAVKQVSEVDNTIGAVVHTDQWIWLIMVSRDLDTIQEDESLQEYCWGEDAPDSLSYSSAFDNGDGFDMQSYREMIHTMRIVRVISVLFIVCISIICMIQLYNTLCANLSIRRKELRLYELVGMGGRQMRRMLLLEHISATVLAVLVGYFIAWGASWYFIEHLLNEMGNLLYTWSGPVVAMMGAGIILLTCLICLIGMRSVRKQR